MKSAFARLGEGTVRSQRVIARLQYNEGLLQLGAVTSGITPATRLNITYRITLGVILRITIFLTLGLTLGLLHLTLNIYSRLTGLFCSVVVLAQKASSLRKKQGKCNNREAINRDCKLIDSGTAQTTHLMLPIK